MVVVNALICLYVRKEDEYNFGFLAASNFVLPKKGLSYLYSDSALYKKYAEVIKDAGIKNIDDMKKAIDDLIVWASWVSPPTESDAKPNLQKIGNQLFDDNKDNTGTIDTIKEQIAEGEFYKTIEEDKDIARELKKFRLLVNAQHASDQKENSGKLADGTTDITDSKALSDAEKALAAARRGMGEEERIGSTEEATRSVEQGSRERRG